MRPAEMRRYSLLGILLTRRAGVKREKSPYPPPPGPLPVPPAPVPVPAVPAPWLEELPVPAILAAGIGDGAGILDGGATTGVASAFFAGAPASFFAWLGLRAGGGGWGGGGGGMRMSNVFNCSTAA